MGDTGGFHCSGQCNCGGLRVVFEYAGGGCEGVSDLGKFNMFVLEVLGMRIMMSERSDGVRPDTVHRNSAEQCSRTVSFFFLPLAYQTLHPLLVISWPRFVLPTGNLKSPSHRVVGGLARLDTS